MARVERDSLGEVEVPSEAYYGSFTARAAENFRISDQGPPRELIQALADIKLSAAEVNSELGYLSERKASAIQSAARELGTGKFDDQFPFGLLQAGAGTPLHMNVNEVIANRATEHLGGEKGEYLVHPNDDVNMGQSSNNVIPTAVRLAVVHLGEGLLGELNSLEATFKDKADQYKNQLKVGRTHYRDAVPITLGQEFHAYSTLCGQGADRIAEALEDLKVIGLGGNAIGTGINTDPSFRDRIAEVLSENSDLALQPAEDPISLTQSMEAFHNFANSLRSAVTELDKICDDLMFLSSGPVAGIAEISLPEVEPGSSIMPGKVNPSIIEAFKMVGLQVKGYAHVISLAAGEGHLELNVMAPVIGKNLLDGVQIFSEGLKILREKCIQGIEVNEGRFERYMKKSTAVATALSPYIGYDRTAEAVHQALEGDRNIRQILLDKGWFREEELDRLLSPERLTTPRGIDRELKQKVRERMDER